MLAALASVGLENGGFGIGLRRIDLLGLLVQMFLTAKHSFLSPAGDRHIRAIVFQL
jgi:hypothetical protein